jgi:hypothetical protein
MSVYIYVYEKEWFLIVTGLRQLVQQNRSIKVLSVNQCPGIQQDQTYQIVAEALGPSLVGEL